MVQWHSTSHPREAVEDSSDEGEGMTDAGDQ